MQMRILHVVPSYLPATRYGGPIHSVHGLCRALVGRGHDVHVFTTSIDGERDSPVPYDDPVDLDGVQVRYFRSPALRRWFWAPALARALARDIGTFDVLHTHSLFLWPTAAAARAARRAGVPYLVAPRGMLVEELVCARSRVAKRLALAMWEKRNLERAAAIHVTSSLEEAEARAFSFAFPPFVVLPNGVSIDDPVLVDPAALRHQVRRAVSRPGYVLFLGRVSWKKGVDRLLEAVALLPGARLVVAGNDDEELLPLLLEQSRRSGLAERTTFVGGVDAAEKAALLDACSLLVLPSLSENFGNVLLEAMAAGRAVVTTPTVGLATAVQRWNAGCVTSPEAHRLATAIGELLSDPDLARRTGANGRRAAREEFSWHRIAGRAESLYSQVIGTAQIDSKLDRCTA